MDTSPLDAAILATIEQVRATHHACTQREVARVMRKSVGGINQRLQILYRNGVVTWTGVDGSLRVRTPEEQENPPLPERRRGDWHYEPPIGGEDLSPPPVQPVEDEAAVDAPLAGGDIPVTDLKEPFVPQELIDKAIAQREKAARELADSVPMTPKQAREAQKRAAAQRKQTRAKKISPKVPKVRTEEEQRAINERMAALRAKRKR